MHPFFIIHRPVVQVSAAKQTVVTSVAIAGGPPGGDANGLKAMVRADAPANPQDVKPAPARAIAGRYAIR